MENQTAALSEAHRLVKDNFERVENEYSVTHAYYLSLKSISAANLPAVLSGIENKERELQTAEDIALWLDMNSIGEKGCIIGLSRAQINRLTLLILNGNRIGDKGCEYLAKGEWPHLKQLFLNDNGITEKGCQHLSKADWKKLQSLNLRNNTIGINGYYLLKMKFPDCIIYCNPEYEQEQ